MRIKKERYKKADAPWPGKYAPKYHVIQPLIPFVNIKPLPENAKEECYDFFSGKSRNYINEHVLSNNYKSCFELNPKKIRTFDKYSTRKNIFVKKDPSIINQHIIHNRSNSNNNNSQNNSMTNANNNVEELGTVEFISNSTNNPNNNPTNIYNTHSRNYSTINQSNTNNNPNTNNFTNSPNANIPNNNNPSNPSNQIQTTSSQFNSTHKRKKIKSINFNTIQGRDIDMIFINKNQKYSPSPCTYNPNYKNISENSNSISFGKNISKEMRRKYLARKYFCSYNYSSQYKFVDLKKFGSNKNNGDKLIGRFNINS